MEPKGSLLSFQEPLTVPIISHTNVPPPPSRLQRENALRLSDKGPTYDSLLFMKTVET